MLSDKACGGFKILTQIITWLLIMGGWWIVNRQNNWREKRKEIRAILNQLQSDLKFS